MTVMWHFDDLKIFHKNPREVTKFIISMVKIYGEGINVTRGKVHSYLGMDFDFYTQGTTKPLMIKYAVQILDHVPEALTTSATFQAAEQLLQVQEYGKKKLT